MAAHPVHLIAHKHLELSKISVFGFLILAATSLHFAGGLQQGRPNPLDSRAIAIDAGSALYRGMNYMPNDNIVVCACAKCGSTSLFKFIYKQKFGRDWSFAGAPYMQEVWSERWAGAFTVVSGEQEQQRAMKQAYSFALVREPKERILSAWSSKVACVDKLSQDVEDRALFVPRLIELAGLSWNSTCLSIHDFLVVLRYIHMANRTLMLNDHFRPQTQECFLDHPPEAWSKIVSISAPGAFVDLAAHIKGPDSETEDAADIVAPVTHTSSHKEYYGLTLEDEVLLDEITEKEYKMLGQFLPKPWNAWNLTHKDAWCENYLDLGTSSTIGQCKALAAANSTCGWQLVTGSSGMCGCVPAGQWCALKQSNEGNSVFQYLKTSFWSLIAEDSYCSGSQDLGFVEDVRECHRKASADVTCGDQLFTNGKSCACILPGQICELQASDQGFSVYAYRSHV